jgi:hypothetical protein
MELSWKFKLLSDLLLRELQSSDRLAYEVRDMDRTPGPLLPDRLLILHKPCMLAIFICVKYSLVLHNQDVLLLPRLKRGWYMIEHIISIACH